MCKLVQLIRTGRGVTYATGNAGPQEWFGVPQETRPFESRLDGSALDGAQHDCDDVSGLDPFDAADSFLDR